MIIDKKRFKGGFIGLIVLLISVTIIMILMFGSRKVQRKDNGDEIKVQKSVIETQLEVVDKAEDVKKMLEGKKYDFE